MAFPLPIQFLRTLVYSIDQVCQSLEHVLIRQNPGRQKRIHAMRQKNVFIGRSIENINAVIESEIGKVLKWGD